MTGLRTSVSLENSKIWKIYRDYLLLQSEKYRAEELLYIDGHILKTTQKGNNGRNLIYLNLKLS